MSLTNLHKGWVGEAMGAVAHWALLDKSVYVPLNNLTLPTKNGTTQIDHVVVSRYGIFVIEAKNIDGWTFGDEHAPQWTVVKPGRKFRFQNPLRQNHRHFGAIAASAAFAQGLGQAPDALGVAARVACQHYDALQVLARPPALAGRRPAWPRSSNLMTDSTALPTILPLLREN